MKPFKIQERIKAKGPGYWTLNFSFQTNSNHPKDTHQRFYKTKEKIQVIFLNRKLSLSKLQSKTQSKIVKTNFVQTIQPLNVENAGKNNKI